jgi:transcriptional regulator with XRE-family HTH domain
MTVADTGLDQREGTLPGRADEGPTAARMRLGTRLRRLRTEAEISREQASEAIRSSESKIARLELGRTAIKTRDLNDLLDRYGVADEAERENMLALSRAGSAADWWQSYGDTVSPWMKPYLGLEQAATLIRSYDIQLIPGLLQTPEYARTLFGLPVGTGRGSAVGRAARGERADRQLALRMRRQQILHRAEPPHLWAVIDEAVLRRQVGGPAVMRAQLGHLLELGQLRHVNLQVLPFRAGGHAFGGPVILLRFAGEQLPDVVYLEQLGSGSYPSTPSDLASYRSMLNQLATEADPPIASAMIIDQIRREL